MEIFPSRILETKGDHSSAWMDKKMLDVTFIIVSKGCLDHDFTEVGPSSYWGVHLFPSKDDWEIILLLA